MKGIWVFYLFEKSGFTDVFRFQGYVSYVFIVQFILEGVVEFRGVVMCSQQLEVFDFIFSIYQQFRSFFVYSDQYIVLYVFFYVVGYQFVGDVISEALVWGQCKGVWVGFSFLFSGFLVLVRGVYLNVEYITQDFQVFSFFI